jgi:hypothetical protein
MPVLHDTWVPHMLLRSLVNTTFLLERKLTPSRTLQILLFEVEMGDKSQKMTLIVFFLYFFFFFVSESFNRAKVGEKKMVKQHGKVTRDWLTIRFNDVDR